MIVPSFQILSNHYIHFMQWNSPYCEYPLPPTVEHTNCLGAFDSTNDPFPIKSVQRIIVA